MVETSIPANMMQLQQIIASLDMDDSQTIEWEEFRSSIRSPILPGVQQVHLALTTDPTEMVVMWVTTGKVLAIIPLPFVDPVDSVVQYGLQSGTYDSSRNGTRSTYNVGPLGWEGWI